MHYFRFKLTKEKGLSITNYEIVFFKKLRKKRKKK